MVLTDQGPVECRMKGKFRLKDLKLTNPVAVGDWVDIQLEEDNTGTIQHIYPRENYIIRKATNLSKEAHIIAANIDTLALIASFSKPTTSLEFIDRYLVTAEAYNIPATLVFNKMDLLNSDSIKKVENLKQLYESIGYNVILSSVKTERGLDQIRSLLENKVTLLSGQSGVGKSSIINAIQPGLDLKTSSVSFSHLKGKHTTTFAEMFPLQFGGWIIDTPGIKSFGLIDLEKEELYHFFPEIFDKAEGCKFHNCLHLKEPGCVVIQAVENGEIADSRYRNYVSMLEDHNPKYRPPQ